MLESLVKYAETHLDTKPKLGFKPKDVRWLIVCDQQGRFLDVTELGDTEVKRNPGQTFRECPEIDANMMQSGGKSHFLVETAEVAVLYGKNIADSKVQEKHRYFVNLLRDASKVMLEMSRLADLLEDESSLVEIGKRLEAGKAKSTDKVTFRIGNSTLVESSVWHDWWREFRKSLSTTQVMNKSKQVKEESADLMRCLASGAMIEPAATHPKVKGLADVGGQSMGTVLVGFDKDSFCSYGFSQSSNAAMSEEAAAAYRAALDDLLKKHSQRLAGAKVVHWFKKSVPPEDDPLPWLVEVGEEQQQRNAQQRARDLLERIRTGKRVDLLGNHFYAMTLSGSGGRVMVRDWMEGQFENLAANISVWFDHLEIVNLSGRRSAKSPSIERVITCLLPERKPSQDYDNWIKPIGTGRVSLWRAAIIDEPIPYTALSRTVMQNRAFCLSGKLEEILDEKNSRNTANSRSLLYARMGLIKAYQIRKDRDGGKEIMSVNLSPYLNEDHPHPAYHCGRLIATLAELQRSALGDVGAGVIQRYYASASSTPALVLGRLTRTSQFHLGKLAPGLTYWYEGKIASIWGRIKDCIPPTLTLEEQSLFALGFYQQLANLRAGSPDKSNEMKESNNE